MFDLVLGFPPKRPVTLIIIKTVNTTVATPQKAHNIAKIVTDVLTDSLFTIASF